MSVIAFLFVIGILIFVHELGHFAIAKWQGVRVEKFSLGFGMKLFSFTRGETEYMICALPLGGYVKMYGEGKEQNVVVDKVREGSNAHRKGFRSGDRIVKAGEVDLQTVSDWSQLLFKLKSLDSTEHLIEIERDGNTVKISSGTEDLDGITAYSQKEYPRSFVNKSVLSRFMIILAGPMMNFVLPFFLLPIAFLVGIKVPAYLEKSPVVEHVIQGSPADEAGFEINDRIISVNGRNVKNWKDAFIIFQSNPDSTVDVEVKRSSELKNLKLEINADENGIAMVGLSSPLPAKIGDVNPGSPAQKAGIQTGDVILKINNVDIPGWTAMSEVIRKKANEQIDVTVNRQGEILKLQVTPEVSPLTNQGIIGVALYNDEITKKYGIIESVKKGITEAVDLTVQITVVFFGFLFNLITGQLALSTAGKGIAGPLFIAKLSGDAAQIGFGQLLQFTSVISINLALINLLPIPVLDGGHILFLSIEKIKGRSVGEKTMEITHRVGFSFLILIMILAVYKDLVRLQDDIFTWLSKLWQIFHSLL